MWGIAVSAGLVGPGCYSAAPWSLPQIDSLFWRILAWTFETAVLMLVALTTGPTSHFGQREITRDRERPKHGTFVPFIGPFGARLGIPEVISSPASEQDATRTGVRDLAIAGNPSVAGFVAGKGPPD